MERFAQGSPAFDDLCPAYFEDGYVSLTRFVDEVFDETKRLAVARAQKWICPEPSSGDRRFGAPPQHRLIPSRRQHRDPPPLAQPQDAGGRLDGNARQQFARVHDALAEIGSAKQHVGVRHRNPLCRRQRAR